MIGPSLLRRIQKLEHPCSGLEERADSEIDQVKEQSDDERQVEGRTDILFCLRTVLLRKLMNTRQSCFEDEFEVVSDENDIDDDLDNEVDLEPPYTLRPRVQDDSSTSFLFIVYLTC